jgi:hypothetical protein
MFGSQGNSSGAKKRRAREPFFFESSTAFFETGN